MAKRLSPKVSLALAITSLILTPILLGVELIMVLFADLVIYEPGNPLFIKVIVVAVVILIAAAGLILPLLTFLRSERVTARVISGIALGIWGLVQVYLLLTPVLEQGGS